MRFPPAERLPLADFSKHAWFRDNRDVTPDTIWVCFCNIYIIFFIKIYLINKLLIITKRVHVFTAFNAHFRSRFAAKMLPVIWGLAGFYVLKSLNPFRANLRGPEERVCFWFSSFYLRWINIFLIWRHQSKEAILNHQKFKELSVSEHDLIWERLIEIIEGWNWRYCFWHGSGLHLRKLGEKKRI